MEGLKRIHLFELEDLSWFPDWIRKCMTRYISAFHKLLGTSDQLSELISTILKDTGESHIQDLCSGDGGLMLDVFNKLKENQDFKDVKLTLSDLYPNEDSIERINALGDSSLTYKPNPTDVRAGVDKEGLRTMICSMHHMPPATARAILADAQKDSQPILIYEISDNSPPIFLWWIAIPIGFIISLFVTLAVRPMTWQQIVFTYLIPILPLAIAWDGSVSNARTYTLDDMDILLDGLSSSNYRWEKKSLPGKGGKKLCLIGKPV